MHFGVEICVNNSGVITDFKVYHKVGNLKPVGGVLSHGWTPIVRPLFSVGEGENGAPITEGFPSNEITVRWHHKFRVGQLGQIFANLLTGVGVPYAWHEIRYKIRSDKTYHIEFYNSAFPSARFTLTTSWSTSMSRLAFMTSCSLAQGLKRLVNFTRLSTE